MGLELTDDDEILANDQAKKQAELDKLQQPPIDPATAKKVNDLESLVKEYKSQQTTDEKIREIQSQLEHKLDLVKEAIATDKQVLAQKRITTLEKLMEKIEQVG